MTTVSSGAATAGEHRTVGRVMAILELVVANDDRGSRLGDLANHVDAPKSSVHGLAKGLVAMGYLREDGARYHVGPALSSLVAVQNASLPVVYRHTLEALSAEWRETSILSTLVGDSAVYLDVVQAKDVLIRAAPAAHVRQPLWPRSSGKLFLAYMEPKRLDAYFRRQRVEPDLEATIREELAGIRRTGIAINTGGNTEIEMGVASPIVRKGAPVTMAIAVAGLSSRMEPHLDEIVESVRTAAESLSSHV
ncbi:MULTISPECIES: IclR family transcriptional regulator [unclassified Microbacterium]|uniref:IclR family transcriptional regulator n=1 Tax=unclassified Microbacterium TaxID=2609290 RepID=UPI00214B8067|nr:MULTISPECIES: IclR family transcriptional regulator [unclassified Microbacterium]MCR2811398.1 IclR family transcriptional regulator [Microbacterium sp. zg.B185]WIM19556.1 IclR family transcriptional regulator [Microbacterium sp. zg-B185]